MSDTPATRPNLRPSLLHHIALRTRDVDRLVAFYERALGLERWPVQAGNGVWLAVGAAVLMIERATDDEPFPPSGGRDLLAFAAPDASLDATRGRLAALGVGLEAETAHTLYFRDPDGRRVALSDFAFPHETR